MIGALERSDCSTSSLVTYCPVLVFFGFSIICILPKSMSPTCFGEAILNFSPANSYIWLSNFCMRSLKVLAVSAKASVSRQTPFISISARTGTNGISIFQNKSSPSTSLSFGSRTFFSRRVMSASSAAYSYMSLGSRSRIDFCDLPLAPISSSMWMVL